MKVCSIFDVKAQAWMTPLFFQAAGQAIRSFGDAVRTPDSEFQKHPEDYTLFLIADWDQSDGKLTVLPAAVPLARGLDFSGEGE